VATPWFQNKVSNFRTKYPRVIDYYNRNHTLLENKIRESSILKGVSWTVGTKPKETSKSFLEAVIISKFASPVTIPVLMIGSVAYVNSRKKLNLDDELDELDKHDDLEQIEHDPKTGKHIYFDDKIDHTSRKP